MSELARPTGCGFEYPVTQQHADGTSSQGLIDLYKRGCFVLESKQFQAAKAKATQLELAAREAGLQVRDSLRPVRGSEACECEAVGTARIREQWASVDRAETEFCKGCQSGEESGEDSDPRVSNSLR